MFGVPNHLLTGIDFYNTQYDSDRSQAPGLARHSSLQYPANDGRYLRDEHDIANARRWTFRLVAACSATSSRPTMSITRLSIPMLDFTPPIRRRLRLIRANGNMPRISATIIALSPAFALFGRVARAFRLPNADERVGAGNPFGFVAPANLNLKTQTSYDAEDGVRVTVGRFNFQSSAYVMELNNEIHFIPALFVDVNLDPTQRLGWENSATYQLSDDVRLRGGFAYTRATFREGPFAGKEVPLVSPWTGYAGRDLGHLEEICLSSTSPRAYGVIAAWTTIRPMFSPSSRAIATMM